MTRSGYNQESSPDFGSLFWSLHDRSSRRKTSEVFGSMEKNMPKVKQINHVAVVVQDMEKALLFWRDALGMELHELRDVPAEESRVAFLPLSSSEVELVLPT